MVNKDSVQRQKKANQIKNIYELCGKYKQIVLVTLENVGSLQCQQIRRDILANNGVLVIGKNTIVKKAISLRMKEFDNNNEEFAFLRNCKTGNKAVPELASLVDLIKEKVGFVFTDQPVFELKPIIEANVVKAAAKVGIISPIDVTIPPGPTGMDPSAISFFHALQISTKIQKGQIEITKDYQVCTIGKKIGNSEVELLQKMNLNPMSYRMNVFAAYDNGSILNQDVISLSPAAILLKFQVGVKNIAAISLETGYETVASVPYSVVNAFKNLAAIGIETGYTFAQLTALGTGAPVAVTGGAQKVEVVEEEVVAEPEEDMDMGGLFD